MSEQPPPDARLFDPNSVAPIDFEAAKPNDEKPMIGVALVAAVEAMIADGRAVFEGGRIIWPKDVYNLVEKEMCPRLANALAQPLQHEWILTYFLAVMMTHARMETSHRAIFIVLGQYIGMACGELPWPAPPTPEEEEEAARMQADYDAQQAKGDA